MTTTAPLRLPVPALHDTCACFLQQVRPLLTAEEFARTEKAVTEFLAGSGPALQAALQDFDAAPENTDASWLIGAWLESYLSGREPLPISTSFGISVPMHGHDLADWVAALARVCADHHHGRIPVPSAPGGTPHCMKQWRILQGASRLALAQIDGYTINEHGSRHIGVLHNGHYHRLLALDESHEALPATHFRQAIAQVAQDPAHNPFPVTLPCYLGSEHASRVVNRLNQIHDDNRRLLDDIRNDLFHVCLRNTAQDEDADHEAATFLATQDVWCYKPVSLIYNENTGRLHLHIEHSQQDGGTLRAIIERAGQWLERGGTTGEDPTGADARAGDQGTPAAAGRSVANTGSAASAETTTAGHAVNAGSAAAGNVPNPDSTSDSRRSTTRRAWQLDAALERQWPVWQAAYAERASQFGIRSTMISFDGQQVPAGVSHDALMQFLMQYAQQATWGRVRNTYEAVDASHFQRGRTECVRPVSEESLAFVKGLLAGSATAEQFRAALLEHKTRIKRCKQGLGPNRHLHGLQLMATRQGMPLPAFFGDKGYQVFTTDFLSTSTLGTGDVILAFAFAPTSAEGLGVNYTLCDEGWRFAVCHRQTQAAEVNAFIGALRDGGQRLLRFLANAG